MGRILLSLDRVGRRMPVDAEVAIERGVAFARSEPETVAAAVVGVVVLVGLGYVLYRLTRPAGVRFASLLADREEVAVLAHPNPDPDAMAAAMGVKEIAEQVDTAATIHFSGQIRHQENRAFRNVLDPELDCIDSADDIECGTVILVDHNRPRGFDGAEDVTPAGVVDHHPGDGRGELFTDVRTHYGACSSIVAEYFRDLDAEPLAPDEHASEARGPHSVPSPIATALFFGILTDTKRLTAGAQPPDFDASEYLSPGIDEDLLDKIANPEVSADVLETKARAISEREVRGSFAVSDVGEVSNADALAQAVEELIVLEGVTAAIVFGIRDGVLHVSGRSRDARVHMGRLLETTLEEVPGGDGGGHAHMGGGQVQLDEGEGFVWPARRDALTDRLWRALDGDV
jgi:nanoRNase/pAp phosphatase (c-di-AMP/oligoRNAs hydrolase)